MRFIKNLKIRDKLLLLLLIVLIPLLYFVGTGLINEFRERKELNEVNIEFEESEKISQLLHEFQGERAVILGYSYSKDPYFYNLIKFHEPKVDRSLMELEVFLEKNNRQIPILQSLNDLSYYRKQAESLALDEGIYDIYSSTIIEKLSNRIQDNATGISDIEVRQHLLSCLNLTNAKLYLGWIKVNILKITSRNEISYEDYYKIFNRLDFYNKAINDFTAKAPPFLIASFEKKTSSKDYQELMTFLSTVKKNPNISLVGNSPVSWYNRITGLVLDIKSLENLAINDLKTMLKSKISEKENRLILYMVVVLTTLFLTIFIAIYIVNNVSRSLRHLKEASEKVILGYTDVDITINSKDEIGSLAESFRRLVSKNQSLSQVAYNIGKGKYDVPVSIEGEQDVLGNAIRDMKVGLERYSIENKNRNWMLTGIGEVNNLLSGAVDIKTTMKLVVEYLVNYSCARMGVLYVSDDYEGLMPSVTYGMEGDEKSLPYFKIGKGQIGEVLSKRKIEVWENVSEEFLKVKSAFSERDKVNLAIVPLILEENILGLIEIASLEYFSSLQIEFLEKAAEKVSTVIHTLKIYNRTQELLYETQNQAEELESQQEELRQINSELKATEEEIKASQEELREKNEELEEKALQLEDQFATAQNKSKEIEEARRAIEQKVIEVEMISKYKSEFLANMSHELRTPLNSILLLSKLIGDNPEKTLTKKQIEHLNIIHNSGNDLLKMINEILDLAKIESGKIHLDSKEIRLATLAVHNQFIHEAEQKKINFNIEFAPDLPSTIYTDKFRLEQILKNLLSNAFKFTPENKKVTFKVFIAKKNKLVFMSPVLQNAKQVLAFAVEDTGIGIPADKQRIVFEAFQQADASTTRNYGGTGLGLAISRELANLLGGEIHLESEENKGSIFTLYLPDRYEELHYEVFKNIHKEAPLIESKKIPEPKPEITPKTKKKAEQGSILIIEDDKGFSKIIADFAEASNVKVFQAYNGSDGLKLAKEQVPNAILLDIHLPDINGWEILKQIKKEERLKNTKIHIMSAYEHEVKDHGEEFQTFLTKPVTLEMLNKAFQSIFNVKKSEVSKVLVVEDNKVENNAIVELLLSHNIQSDSAYSGTEAFKKIQDSKVDCLILDLNLPDMGGYDLMEKIRNSTALSNLFIIVYSGKDLSEEEERRLKKYANTIIIKNQFSYIRLLDEVQLFLKNIGEKVYSSDSYKMKLHIPQKLLRDKKVLIVDDDVRNVYSLFSVLEAQSMQIVIANDGKEALEKMKNEMDIDIVLMDIMMPVMDGIEAIKAARRNPDLKNLPIVALTAKAMKGDREKCLQAGATDYISKPIDTEKLLALMRVLLYDIENK